MAVVGVVNVVLTPGELAHLRALGVVPAAGGGLRSGSGAPVSAGTALALLEKAVAGYPDVQVTPGTVPDPAAFNRPHLRDGHAAQNATDWTVNTPPHGAVGVIGERERERAGAAEASDSGAAEKKAHGKRARREQREARRAKSGREAEEAAHDAGPRTHVETVKAVAPADFTRGYLAAGHQVQSPAVTGVRGTVGLPPSNVGVFEPQVVDRPWLQQGHQTPSPGDEPDNNPNPPDATSYDVYASARRAYEENRRDTATAHVEETGSLTAVPAIARWAPASGLGASNMPHAVSTSGLPVGCAPGE